MICTLNSVCNGVLEEPWDGQGVEKGKERMNLLTLSCLIWKWPEDEHCTPVNCRSFDWLPKQLKDAVGDEDLRESLADEELRCRKKYSSLPSLRRTEALIQ